MQETKKKLLIVSYFFPPLDNIAARRWASMEKELEKEYKVFIFTSGVENVINEDRNNIFRFGSISNLVSKVEENKRGIIHSFISKNFTHEVRSFDHTYKSWFLKYRRQMEFHFKQIKPEVLLTTFGPIGPSLIGNYFKRRYPSTFWVADLRDSVSILNNDQKNFLQRQIDSRLDRSIHAKADLICTVSKTLARLMSEFYKKEVFTLYNGFEGLAISVQHDKVEKGIMTAYYAGYIYEHRKKSFVLFARACKALNIKFKVRLLCSPNEWTEMNSIVEKNDLSNSVELLKPAEPSVIFEEELRSDLLVILEDMDLNSEVTKGNLTGKLFEYLKFPSPIIAVCRADSEIGDILKETRRGILVDSYEGIINSIDTLPHYRLDSPSQISTYSRSNQAWCLLKKLNQCL